MKQIFCLLLSLFAVTYAQKGRGIKIRSDSARITFGKKLDVTIARKPDGALMVKAKYVEVKALKVNGKSLADYIVMTTKKRLNQICPKCGAGGAATKKPAPKFAMAGNGKASCGSSKLAPVKTENGCKAAAKSMKKPFGSSGSYATYPKGCYFYNKKVYFNKAKTGKGNSKASPVCVGKATAGKKTTPKKKPANPCAKNNGGCTKARKCMNVKGKAVCGKCPKGYTNSGTKQCKKAAATKKPTKKLVQAGNGKASCAGKGAAVTSEAGCKAAAKAMKKPFGSSGSYASYPKGCFVYNKKLYYNKGKTGKANSKASPVCVSGAGATGGKKTKKPSLKLVLGASGKPSCQSGGSKMMPVKNEAGCKAAAKAMKKPFGFSMSMKNYPAGCYYNTVAKKIFYNKAKTGKGNKNAHSVCTLVKK